MIIVSALFIALVLGLTSALHFYWAAGGMWPARDEQSLARTVIGGNGIAGMPDRRLTIAVASCIALAAVWPMLWLGWIVTPAPDWLLTAGMAVLSIVFIARGIAGFVPAVKKRNSEEPFATLNARYFSPLIVLLGLILTVLLLTDPRVTP
ncbi:MULTISPECIES: DUF3995 domain-containing protein [Hoeflea]|uniref:DUF3995 domain-containing protein n=2 Tax=Hoeflea alexandrii TaxID=288436 RepID=A0ABT1CTM2_9HYPH|nr:MULTISPECIES: DUF3995 domain-containing protein [Hoeflea]MCO6409513.1 DUF3995 domain-containing protein [Hoeflea alexandrii]VVT21828.1 conserved membrane hypothetical protein [Hoeflea sp. EC-HK425]